MNREELPQEASREDKMRDALKHYEELATKACWHRSDIPDAIRAYYASLPPAEGAEEILRNILAEIWWGDPVPADVFKNPDYKITFLDAKTIAEKFATLHAQRIAEKMVEEKLRTELIEFICMLSRRISGISDDNMIELVDEYLKSREK